METDNLYQFDLSFTSQPENIKLVEAFIDQTRAKFDITDDVYGNIMIAVTEAVNNAILHGNNANPTKQVQVRLEMDDTQAHFSIMDEGDGFDHTTLPDPTSPEFVDLPGGRGIFLIRHLADEVKFDKDGTDVRITFYLT
jgi:serine/threonine-protein kinase RsbW